MRVSRDRLSIQQDFSSISGLPASVGFLSADQYVTIQAASPIALPNSNVLFHFTTSPLQAPFPSAWTYLPDSTGSLKPVLFEQRSFLGAVKLFFEQNYPDEVLEYAGDTANNTILLARAVDGTVVGYSVFSPQHLSPCVSFDRVHSLHHENPHRGVKGIQDAMLGFYLRATRQWWDGEGKGREHVVTNLLPNLLERGRARLLASREEQFYGITVTVAEARLWAEYLVFSPGHQAIPVNSLTAVFLEEPDREEFRPGISRLEDLGYGQDRPQRLDAFAQAFELWNRFPKEANPLSLDFEPEEFRPVTGWFELNQKILNVLGFVLGTAKVPDVLKLETFRACQNLAAIPHVDQTGLRNILQATLILLRHLAKAQPKPQHAPSRACGSVTQATRFRPKKTNGVGSVVSFIRPHPPTPSFRSLLTASPPLKIRLPAGSPAQFLLQTAVTRS